MADPISAAIIGQLAINTATAVGALTAGLIEVGVGLAINKLAQMIFQPDQQEANNPGIRTQITLEGETAPQTLLIGRTATAGHAVAPYMATGRISGDEDLNNAFRWMVIDYANYPANKVNRFWVNDVKFDNPTHLTGDAMTGFRNANATTKPNWREDVDQIGVRFYDGTQTAASTNLVNQFSGRSRRPWLSTAIGTGVAYGAFMFRYDVDMHRGDPAILVEWEGAKVYHRNQDTTNGGSGTQREGLANYSTHTYDENPITWVENIIRGITLHDDSVWGFGVDWADMPYSNWQTARTVCNETMADGRNRYTCGMEVRMGTPDAGGDDPWSVVEKLLASCSGSIADCGGKYYVEAGPPALASFSITDGDLLAAAEQEFSQHNGHKDRFNSGRVSHPNPGQRWAATESDIYVNTGWQAADGEPLFADLKLPAVYNKKQASQQLKELIRDSRNTRAFTIQLPEQFSGKALPLRVFSWTSTRWAMTSKLFRISECSIDPDTLEVTVSCKEVNHNDWNEDAFTLDDDPDADEVTPTLQSFPYTSIAAHAIKDENGSDRQPGIKVIWPTNLTGVKWIAYEVRAKTSGVDVADGTWTNPKRGKGVIKGLIPNRNHEVRLKSNKHTWTAWITVKTAKIRIGRRDLENGAAGGRKRKPHTMKNLIPLWDIDDDVVASGDPDDDDSFETSNCTYTVLGSANTGRQSIRVTRTAAGSYWIQNFEDQFAPVSGGTKYYMETMLRTNGASGAGGLVRVQGRFYRADGATEVDQKTLMPFGSHPAYDGTYRKFSDRMIPHADSRLVKYRVFVDAAGPAYIDIDRVMMDEATGGEKIHDGDIGKRQGKKGDFTLITRFEKNDRWNTAPKGTPRELIGGTVECDGETKLDFILSFMGDSLGEKVNGKMEFDAQADLRFYAGGTKFHEETIYWEADENRPKRIIVQATDNAVRNGKIKYRVDVYRKNNSDAGCEFDARHIKLKVGRYGR